MKVINKFNVISNVKSLQVIYIIVEDCSINVVNFEEDSWISLKFAIGALREPTASLVLVISFELRHLVII